ncbi:Hypothetical protein bglu_1g15390 [Burkholderia glumae BGR1]|nr:Hypothetical protein bglu_1g15390 [Burkholderia glumae BGR1]
MSRCDVRRGGLRCKPGDLARIVEAWNELLIGQIVHVQAGRPGRRWMTLLLGDPALTIREDGRGYVATRRFVAEDVSLVPLSECEAAEALAALSAQAFPARRSPETAEGSISRLLVTPPQGQLAESRG